MKAVVLKKNGNLSYEDVPIPILRHREVLVKVKACGICGSDLRYLKGENPWSQHTLGYTSENPDNIILGHEFSGDVVKVHDKEFEYLLGRRVAVLVYNTCGVCEFCRTNHENICQKTSHIGHGAGWEDMDYYPGGMAEYCQVWSTHVYPLSDSITYEEASTLDFFAVGMHAVKLATNLLAGDVAIIGTGPVGLGIAQIVRLFGAKRVYCIDVYDKALEVAMNTGADKVIKASMSDPVSNIMDFTGGSGCKAVFDCVGEVETQQQAIKMLGGGGTLVNLVAKSKKVEYSLMDLSAERSIRCAANNPFEDFHICLKLMEAGRLDAKPLITHILELGRFREGFDLLLDRNKSNAVKVILKPD